MNKITSFVLLGALLLMCFSGCAITNYTNDDKNQNTSSDTTVKDNNILIAVEGKLDKSSKIVCSLIEYLQSLFADYDLPATSTAMKINEIKNGKQALHVRFNESECYFVCAYYNTVHNNEAIDYCCATNYTWVKFNNANEITAKYDDLNFVVGFQINKASFVTDIVTKDATVPAFEHFQEYAANFNNGLNINDATEFDANFIYLNSTDDETVYHSLSVYYNTLVIIPCVSLVGKSYVVKALYTIYPDGTRYDNNVVRDFDEYYDILAAVMDTGCYSKTDDKGRSVFYGLIEIDDFANCINR